MKKLEHKTALVIGGGSGMGYAAAKEFLDEGATVIITARNEKKLREAMTSLGSSVQGILSDADELHDVESLPDKVMSISPGLDVVLLDAVCSSIQSINLSNEGYFDAMEAGYDERVSLAIQQLLPIIHNGGSIVVNNTTALSKARPDYSALSTFKGRLKLTKGVARELEKRNIRAHRVSTGGFFEPSTTIRFLASDDSNYITGIDLAVDGDKILSSNNRKVQPNNCRGK